MQENDFIYEFYARLCEVSNEAFYLGERFSNVKLVRKVLGFFPE